MEPPPAPTVCMSSMGTPIGKPAISAWLLARSFSVNQRDVGGCAAHIEGDDSFEAAAARHGGGSYHSSCRPGKHGAYRFAGGGSESRDPSTGLHNEDAGLGAAIVIVRLNQILQIALHHRLQVGVHHNRAGAFVFAELGKNLVRD